MGTYVFSRLDDMFEFFRTDRLHSRNGDSLAINPSYWGEKLQAIDRGDGYKKWSADRFNQIVKEQLVEWWRESGLDREGRKRLREEVTSDVLDHCFDDDSGHFAMQAAFSFETEIGGRKFEFVDFFDHQFEEYSYRFIWCCYAIAWGVKHYDEQQPTAELAA
jgi:hypothetical protein